MPADFSDVFASQHGYVVHSLRRLGVPDRDLEDVAHDAFIVVHRKLGDYDPARPLRPFLFGIAYRVALDYRRRARHHHEFLIDDAGRSDADDTPEQQLHIARAQQLALAALRRLDPQRSAVLVLVDIDGCTAPEVASTLAIPLNTVYSRLRVARSEFAEAVRRLRLSRRRP